MEAGSAVGSERTAAGRWSLRRSQDIFNQLGIAGINLQETENVVLEGAAAAVARIHLDDAPSPQVLGAMRAESADIIHLSAR